MVPASKELRNSGIFITTDLKMRKILVFPRIIQMATTRILNSISISNKVLFSYAEFD
jgi:hypothetical protein